MMIGCSSWQLGQQRGEVRDYLSPEETVVEFQRVFSGIMLLWAFADPEKPWSECKKKILRAVWSAIKAPNRGHKGKVLP